MYTCTTCIIYIFKIGMTCNAIYGSGHRTVAVLLHGYAIKRQLHLCDPTHILMQGKFHWISITKFCINHAYKIRATSTRKDELNFFEHVHGSLIDIDSVLVVLSVPSHHLDLWLIWTYYFIWCKATVNNYFFMPPPLGAGGIMFSGCPSVRPSEASNTLFWPVHRSVGLPDQP